MPPNEWRLFMIITVKHIVITIWVLLTIPVIIMGFKWFIDDFLPTPKNGARFFVYLLTSRLFYFNGLIWLICPWINIKKELGFVPISYALQQICWSIVMTTILLSIKYYKSRRALQMPNEESKHQL